MRIGTRTRPGLEGTDARAAEAIGAFGALIEPDAATTAIAAAEAATTTRTSRLIVRMVLGIDHPVTLAEDLAVLDNISNGRVVALLDTSTLEVGAAREDLTVLVAGLTPRPVQHAGERWRVPARLEGHDAPDRIEVTPKPVQVEIPVWLIGAAATQLSRDTGYPVVADRPEEVDASRSVQPGLVWLSGDRDVDRELVTAWRDAGATHLLVGADDMDATLLEIARYLIPEVAMPDFPRIIAEAMTPRRWPGPARYVAASPQDQGRMSN